jgi:hypothetical protein
MQKFCQADIIDSALMELGHGVIDVEVQKYAPDSVVRLYKKSLEDINAYIPEIREQTITVQVQNQRNGIATIPDTYLDGRDNDPIAVVDVQPTGLSFYERNYDLGVLTFNRFLYTYEPGTDALLLDNFKSRKRIYGLEFRFKQDLSNPKKFYFDDIPYTSNSLTAVFLNNWKADVGHFKEGESKNWIYGIAANKLITLLSARLKKVTGQIRSKLSGGERAAILDGQQTYQAGVEEERAVMEEIRDLALNVGIREQ